MNKRLIIAYATIIVIVTICIAYILPLLVTLYKLTIMQHTLIVAVIAALAIIFTVTAVEYFYGDEAMTKELDASTGDSNSPERLISTISHQLRTPITSLKWSLESMVSDMDQKKPIDNELISGALDASIQVSTLIEDLLAGVHGGMKTHAAFKPVDVEKYIGQVVDGSYLALRQKEMHLEVKKNSHSIPHIDGDMRGIRFVLHTLISNAIQYGQSKTTVTVSVEKNDNSVIVHIHNTGKVIPRDEQGMIFGQFNRGTEAVRQNPNGSGLGLYLSKKIVTEHGGTISFESDYDKGTVFTVSLPISHLAKKLS